MADKVWLKELDFKEINFDHYLQMKLRDLPPDVMALVPPLLRQRIFRKKVITLVNVTIAEKLYLITEVLQKKWYVIIDGSGENGLPINTLHRAMLNKRYKRPIYDTARSLVDDGLYIMGDKSLIESLSYTRLANSTYVYKTAIPAALRRDEPNSQYKEHRKAYKGLVSMFARYEMSKGVIHDNFLLGVPEWCTMLYLSLVEEGERVGLVTAYRGAVGVKEATLIRALTKLMKKGLIECRGRGHKRLYSLTARGDLVILQIMQDIIKPLVGAIN